MLLSKGLFNRAPCLGRLDWVDSMAWLLCLRFSEFRSVGGTGDGMVLWCLSSRSSDPLAQEAIYVSKIEYNSL